MCAVNNIIQQYCVLVIKYSNTLFENFLFAVFYISILQVSIVFNMDLFFYPVFRWKYFKMDKALLNIAQKVFEKMLLERVLQSL